MIASGDPIIRPLYKLHGTETGRLSCENPNIQQFPESLKSLIMAREGHTLIGWDYSQLEVRVQAWLCEDPLMISMLESGVDFHAETGKLLGLDRRDAKRLNFLIQYGGGAAKAARTLGISQSAAQKLITEYYKRFAGLAQWKEKIREQIIKEGVVETPFGRARHFDFITDRLLPNLHREACNFVPQSVASDLNLWTALAVYKRTGIPACLLVHDFAAFEVPNEQLEDFLPVIKEELQKLPEPMQIKNSPIAFEAKVKIGPSWGAMKEVD
jgi:DNA polymerase-1